MSTQSIPKVIHYCWFGRNPLPKSAIRCINSWKKFLPDYEIKEWNEDNFDVNFCTFTSQAYKAKKYAFVSDVARFWVLAREGGLYFDTDVEVVKSFDDIIAQGAFMGIEVPGKGGQYPLIAPGLALGAEAGNELFVSILKHYEKVAFVDESGAFITKTVGEHTTEILISKYKLKPQNEVQVLSCVTVYPMDYFNPFDDATGVLTKTKNTHSIHWYSKSWIDKPSWYFFFTRLIHRFFGVDSLARFRK